MPRHKEQQTLAYTADELFSVVADVKDYPSFGHWFWPFTLRISYEPLSRLVSLADAAARWTGENLPEAV
jgi:hypothetical protein